jgi:hypothetical protein
VGAHRSFYNRCDEADALLKSGDFAWDAIFAEGARHVAINLPGGYHHGDRGTGMGICSRWFGANSAIRCRIDSEFFEHLPEFELA